MEPSIKTNLLHLVSCYYGDPYQQFSARTWFISKSNGESTRKYLKGSTKNNEKLIWYSFNYM
jgi:hypothetical protein